MTHFSVWCWYSLKYVRLVDHSLWHYFLLLCNVSLQLPQSRLQHQIALALGEKVGSTELCDILEGVLFIFFFLCWIIWGSSIHLVSKSNVVWKAKGLIKISRICSWMVLVWPHLKMIPFSYVDCWAWIVCPELLQLVFGFYSLDFVLWLVIAISDWSFSNSF